MKLSVIIPVYNGGKYLSRSIPTVFAQSVSDIQIILVDDGSTDDTGKICDEYSANDNRIHVIHKENGGVSSARNVGIEYVLKNAAEKEFIAFLDADDIYKPGVITDERLNKAADCDIIAFAGIYAYSNDTVIHRRGPDHDESFYDCYKHIWDYRMHFCAKLVSTHLLSRFNIRFDVELKYNEDYVFMDECMYLANKMAYYNDVLHVYYMDIPNSAVNTQKKVDPFIRYPVDGWVRFDDFVNQYESETGIHSEHGSVKAALHMLQIAEEYFAAHKKDENNIIPRIKNNPHYTYFCSMDWDETHKPSAELFINNTDKFIRHTYMRRQKLIFQDRIKVIKNKILK